MLGKLLYGVLFMMLAPVLLVWWARASAATVPLPTVPYPWVGLPIIAVGVGLIGAGMGALMVYGRGLPMNPYPPPVYVARGIYRFTPHPIYVGFVLCSFGASIALESASGFWLVSPVVALALTALVMGYERHDLIRRFGADAMHAPLISLPPDRPLAPTRWHRASVYLLVFVPWAAAFEAVYWLGVPQDGIVGYFAFERTWPVLEWTEAIYASVYFFVLAAPLIVRTQRDLRTLAVTGLVATAVVIPIYITVPVIVPPRPFEPSTILGRVLMIERGMANTVGAFPAFHVIWSFIAADAWATRSRSWRAAAWVWAALITISCITTGMHALLDIVAAALVFFVVRRYRRVWHVMRRGAEAVANSWHEWHWRRVRLINHGIYAGLGGTVGLWISGLLSGGTRVFWQVGFVYLCGLLGAALWAQQLEGSSKLSRPFGYYGSVIGAVAGTVIVGMMGGDTLLVLALVAMAAPWIQALGRLRCLVQGCCHGAEAPEGVGIRYWQRRSRVCALAELRGVPLHPTPLYSILGNLVIGVLLLRLWSLGAAFGLIAGGYFLLAGVARFIEESYRGEPQTPRVAGLRLYQWLALLSMGFGVALTTLPGASAPGLVLAFDVRLVVGGILYGILAGLAMGVDFPGSARRFARLAPS
jgi:hypothetical protein